MADLPSDLRRLLEGFRNESQGAFYTQLQRSLLGGIIGKLEEANELVEQLSPRETQALTTEYTAGISRSHPGCIVFLLDQSVSMSEGLFELEGEKHHAVADACNGLLQNLILECTHGGGVAHELDIALLGYGGDEQANPVIRSFNPVTHSFELSVTADADPPLLKPHDALHPITQFHEHAKVQERIQKQADAETGEILEFEIEQRFWVSAKARGEKRVCWALYQCYHLLEEWINDHPDNFPPIVLHLTDGEFWHADGNPDVYVDSLASLATNDGNVLLANCQFSRETGTCVFPSSREMVPSNSIRIYNMSSVIPDILMHDGPSGLLSAELSARGMGYSFQPGVSKAMMCNGNLSALVHLLPFERT